MTQHHIERGFCLEDDDTEEFYASLFETAPGDIDDCTLITPEVGSAKANDTIVLVQVLNALCRLSMPCLETVHRQAAELIQHQQARLDTLYK